MMVKYLWLALLALLAVVLAVWPELDSAVTQRFYVPGEGFPAQNWLVTQTIHDIASGWFPRILGLGLIMACLGSLWRRCSVRPWLYLLLCLLLGPGLLANIALKDQWGRARPLQTLEFGGQKDFTPWWQPAQNCSNNCSFISGDGSFGFMLAAPGMVVPRRRRFIFWGLTAVGAGFGVTRIVMGAHFLSDTVWAALLMFGTMFALYALIFGRDKAGAVWREL